MKKIIATIILNLSVFHLIISQSLPSGTTAVKPYLTSNKVSIGSNPATLNKLYIEDNSTNTYPVDERDFIKLNNTDVTTNSAVTHVMTAGTSGARLELGIFGSNYGNSSYLNSTFANRGTLIARGGSGLVIRSSPDANGYYVFDGITFQVGANTPERMRITGDGNVGIGTTAPNAKLQVTNGDVYVENPSRGIILKSPNGTCWRVTIDDTGNFVRNQITCP
ncbi:hypothetical protein LV89_02665 [Arcicella aurantiaca]|uniref:Uncharacterized protein n=1 Tax=Arcicella aurantiaca TaxID=591202 RepID=A0A316E6Y1_9BACT|nr:hypothetical protein [Arcicella aurantiaca]PWK26184.1 hypothetical protein LV89_02665 [Arcicella aurantiaca]